MSRSPAARDSAHSPKSTRRGGAANIRDALVSLRTPGLQDHVLQGLSTALKSRVKAAAHSAVPNKISLGFDEDITLQDVIELIEMLGDSSAEREEQERMIRSQRLRLSRLLSRNNSSQGRPGLDKEGFILLAGPLLGVQLPALQEQSMVPDPDRLNSMHSFNIAKKSLISTFFSADPEASIGTQAFSRQTSGLRTNDSEAEEAFDSMGPDSDGYVKAEQLLEHLLRGGSQVALLLDIRADASQEKMKSREGLTRTLAYIVNRDDAFGTLVFNLVFLAIVALLITNNLQIYNRQRLEHSLEEHILTYSNDLTGPFFTQRNVYDVDSFWNWLDKSGAGAIYGSPTPGEGTELRIRSSSALIGDACLTLTAADNEKHSVWLLHTDEAKAYLLNKPKQFESAARETINTLRKSSLWTDPDTRDLSLQFASYSKVQGLMSTMKVRVDFQSTGAVLLLAVATAVPSNIKPGAVDFALDVFYLLGLFILVVAEGRDLVLASCSGFTSFIQYWTVWNFVDWASITVGFLNMSLWVAVGNTLKSQKLEKATQSGSWFELDASALTDIQDQLDVVIWFMIGIHFTLAFTVVLIIFKFFKGYRANPRLQVVAVALQNSLKDILHFFIVFWTIFICFAVIAHTLFGSDIQEFQSLASSLKYSMSTLLGEFSWYVDAQQGGVEDLPSGMPRVMLTIWFLFFMIFVLLVLMNMLLAMVLERYMEVAQVLVLRQDAPAIWVQSYAYIRRKWSTFGHIPLNKLSADLSADEPTHPKLTVTATSLLEAFPTMKHGQAVWIMNMLYEEEIIYKLSKAVEPGDRSLLHLSSESGPDGSVGSVANADKVAELVAARLAPELAAIRNELSSRLAQIELIGKGPCGCCMEEDVEVSLNRAHSSTLMPSNLHTSERPVGELQIETTL